MAWGHERSGWGNLQRSRRRQQADWKEEKQMITSKITEEDRSFVLQLLGEASLGMWVDTPKGVFDHEKAIEFADRIIERMEQIAQR